MLQSVRAQSIPNPSFEANTFTTAPGFISDNAEITGWATDSPAGVGLSPVASDATFANNGTVPDGNAVAFLTGGTSLRTTITGLTAGKVYKVVAQVNATTATTATLRANVDDTDLLTLNVYPVATQGTPAPYEYVAFEFTATAATAAFVLLNDAASDQTLLIDNLTIAESSGKWVLDAWTDDTTSGVDSQYVYTHAYSFGTTTGAVINDVAFTGVGGANPAVTGRFSTARFGNVFTGDANNVTGGGSALARDFVYSGANVVSGDYQTVTIQGLTPGTEYVATLFSMAWEDPTTGARWATLSMGNDRLTVNQDQFGNNNGIRFSYRYTANAEGTAVLNIAPINPVNVSIHVYGFANREAVSRNVLPTISVQPSGSILSEGLPLDLTVSATGFPTPTFQWRKNGNALVDATANTFSIPSVNATSVADYDVVVKNSVGSVTSRVASVVVGIPLTNPSFEVDAFESWPGYSGPNPGNPNTPAGENFPITGWTQSSLNDSGINPILTGESPFADNGTIPHGKQVAFLQTRAEPITLSQTISGLAVGTQYYLHYYENARSGPVTAVEVKLGENVAVPLHEVASGGYKGVYTDVFTAAAETLDVTFTKSSPGGGDTTYLLDSVAVVPVAANTKPFVTRNPVAAAGYIGDTVTLSGQVIGSLPLTYQWLKGGEPVPGGAGATLSLSSLKTTDAGDYTLKVTNSAGEITTTVAHVNVNQRVPGLFNTGIDDAFAPVADGEADPHYSLVVNPHSESTDAIVEDSTVFPIVAGPWLPNTDKSKWIGPELNTAGGAVGFYTFRTIIDLTGRDLASVMIRGQWASDNSGRDIQVNGVTTGNVQSPGFGSFTPFNIDSSNATFKTGTNYIDFIVENEAAVGYTGVKIEIVESNANPGGGTTKPTLAIARVGNSITVSWTPTAAGQKLQTATTINGQWDDVTGAASPYTANIGSGNLFFRVSQ
jgi:hypothetical protein